MARCQKKEGSVPSTPEIVVEVVAEGGSLKLHRVRRSDGTEVFTTVLNEVALYDMLSDDELEGMGGPIKTDMATTFDGAMELLDRHEWAFVRPWVVHPEFSDRIWNAILQRSATIRRTHQHEERFALWATMCGKAEWYVAKRKAGSDQHWPGDYELMDEYEFTASQVEALGRSGFVVAYLAELKSRVPVFDGDVHAHQLGVLTGSAPAQPTQPVAPMPSEPDRESWDDWLKMHGHSDFGDSGAIDDGVRGVVLFESRAKTKLARVVIFPGED